RGVLDLRRPRVPRPRRRKDRARGADRAFGGARALEAIESRVSGKRGEPRAVPLARVPRGRRLSAAWPARRGLARRRDRRAPARGRGDDALILKRVLRTRYEGWLRSPS